MKLARILVEYGWFVLVRVVASGGFFLVKKGITLTSAAVFGGLADGCFWILEWRREEKSDGGRSLRSVYIASASTAERFETGASIPFDRKGVPFHCDFCNTCPMV